MNEMTGVASAESEVGSYVVAQYPPVSSWTEDAVSGEALPALDREPTDSPLGLYLHIPFCKKHCHFCYFPVLTGQRDEDIERYVDLLVNEWALYAPRRAVFGRDVSFIYIGGGTPSVLSAAQLQGLVARLGELTPWTGAEEITFECEPGTLNEVKLRAIRQMGVTRLSIGVETFDNSLLELNGRAHRAVDSVQAFAWARNLEFPHLNIDLLAGILGETDATWRATVAMALRLSPDSITIYPMELGARTAIGADAMSGGGRFSASVAPWAIRRRWVREAFEAIETAGYQTINAYTAVKDPAHAKFVYVDKVWQGADLVGLGLGAVGHLNGVQVQNFEHGQTYATAIDKGELPFARAHQSTAEERMIRELVLQLKRGIVRPAYFAEKFDVDILRRFPSQFAALRANGYATSVTAEAVRLSRDGLLRVDALLPRFFLSHHAGAVAS